jgi:hypothetical protein
MLQNFGDPVAENNFAKMFDNLAVVANRSPVNTFHEFRLRNEETNAAALPLFRRSLAIN